MYGLDAGLWAAAAGLFGGCLLGLAARVGRFCIMGAVEDAVYGADLGRLRMLAMAAAVAIAGTFLLMAAGGLDPAATRYFRIAWSPAGAVVGGLLFGFGMAQVGTCGFGALARLGGGDLRALVMVLVIGITAYATLSGPLAPLRHFLVPPDAPVSLSRDGLAHGAGALTGLPPLVPALMAAAALAAWALLDPRFRGITRHSVWSVAVGAAIVLAWATTSAVARGGFGLVPVESFSFVAPVGESLVYAMTSAGTLPDFSIGSVAGVILGAAIGSAVLGEARWEACDDARELRRQMGGAALMGIGGVLAFGCTVGQGLSALSVLSMSAPIVIVAIMLGARAGLFLLVERGALQR